MIRPAATITFSYTWYDEASLDEVEIEVEAEISTYYPSTGPTYASGGEQECGGEVELIVTLPDGTELENIPADLAECLEARAHDLQEQEL